MKRKKQDKKNKIWPVVGMVVAVFLVAGLAFTVLHLLNSKDDKTKQDNMAVNYDDPTEEQIQAGQDIKDKNEIDGEDDPIYSIFVVDAEQYGSEIEVRSYVDGVVEDGGICTYTFKNGAEILTKTSSGFANASYTTCTTLVTQASEFTSSGTWELTISYASSNVTANSEAMNVEVSK